MLQGTTKKYLKNVTENLDKVKPLLETCDKAYDILMSEDHERFLYMIGKSWSQKKKDIFNNYGE